MSNIIDNFKILGNKLVPKVHTLLDEDNFWVIQIIKRRKDNPGLPRNEKLIDTFYIETGYELEDIKQKVVDICEANNARGYFFVNRRNYKKVAFEMLKRLSVYIADGNWKSCKKSFDKSVGQTHSEFHKNWVVDVDEGHNLPHILQTIGECYRQSGEGNIVTINPSVTGSHIICSPFNLKYFQERCPGVDVGKNDVTLIYFKKLDNEEFADSVLNECDIL